MKECTVLKNLSDYQYNRGKEFQRSFEFCNELLGGKDCKKTKLRDAKMINERSQMTQEKFDTATNKKGACS